MKSRVIPLFFAMGLLFFMASSSFTKPAHAAEAAPICFTVVHNVRYGQQDNGMSADVSTLQQFLSAHGYFDSANLGTGHFGPFTLRAVKKFQADNGVPATGFVGPLTRAALMKAQPSCGVSSSPATLYAVSPSSGPIGTQVSIRGFGFSSSNTVLIDGLVAARNVPISSSIAIACTTDPSCHGGINQTITFTLPSYASPDCPVGSMCPMFVRELMPADVTITVRNDASTSNGLPFSITK